MPIEHFKCIASAVGVSRAPGVKTIYSFKNAGASTHYVNCNVFSSICGVTLSIVFVVRNCVYRLDFRRFLRGK